MRTDETLHRETWASNYNVKFNIGTRGSGGQEAPSGAEGRTPPQWGGGKAPRS